MTGSLPGQRHATPPNAMFISDLHTVETSSFATSGIDRIYQVIFHHLYYVTFGLFKYQSHEARILREDMSQTLNSAQSSSNRKISPCLYLMHSVAERMPPNRAQQPKAEATFRQVSFLLRSRILFLNNVCDLSTLLLPNASRARLIESIVMSIGVFDLFKIGIGPSSSHTVGPMKAAKAFAESLAENECLLSCHRLRIELFGSLGATGAGHGSPKAIIMGLEGESPENVDVERIAGRVQGVRDQGRLRLLGRHTVAFHYRDDLILHRRKSLPFHPNGMRFSAFDSSDNELLVKAFYSIGGGFIIDESAAQSSPLREETVALPYPFSTGDELLRLCKETGLSISSLMLCNEKARQKGGEIYSQLMELWTVMNASIENGCRNEGIMPGGLKVKRRAPQLHRKLHSQNEKFNSDPLSSLDWVTLSALAVNEENAVGGRVVTAPTNGAAGIIPAVLRYYLDSCENIDEDAVCRFLLTAGAIGILYKTNASISGAEVGCQGEVGSACSMAAAALAELMGATPEQVENAAEIAMEHNLGLTCDPIGGLVQVPCIERNAMAAIKAISAARMALRGNGEHYVSLDQVIKTMRDTGRDMKVKYKETARGGLAINVLEVPVSVVDC